MPDELARGGERHQSLLDALRIELGLRDFLTDNGYHGFTDTFEILHGLKQLDAVGRLRVLQLTSGRYWSLAVVGRRQEEKSLQENAAAQAAAEEATALKLANLQLHSNRREAAEQSKREAEQQAKAEAQAKRKADADAKASARAASHRALPLWSAL